MRAALYARVSTFDQDPDVQLYELRELARQRGWTSTEYSDHGVSGLRASRPALDQLRADVKRGRVDVVVVWKLDRLGRSLLDLVHVLDELTRSGVGFVSARDPGIDTTTALGRLLLQIVGAFAQFERDLIAERTRAGLARARAAGVRLGRPLRELDPAAAEAALRAHGSERLAAAALGVPRSTLRARLTGLKTS